MARVVELSQDTAQKICAAYNLGAYVSAEAIGRGTLNDNYSLETSTGKYFLKSVREKAKAEVGTIYAVESFMKAGGIPAVVMLETVSGEHCLTDGEQLYLVYPFIESDTSGRYAESDYQRMGEMLGRIHRVGSGSIPDIPLLKQFKRPADEVIVERLKNYKEEIIAKDHRDEVDEEFLSYIDFKLETLPKLKCTDLENDTLIHGDYHSENLLIDRNTREIIGICDWEKAEFGPRAYGLARSLFYICFYDGYKLDEALLALKFFFDGYVSVYPMTTKEILDGLRMRIARMTLSSWIEGKYYKEEDSRANKFISNEMNLIDFVTNGDLLTQIEKLLD